MIKTQISCVKEVPIKFAQSQRGVVLFIAMIALVVMSLAGVALIRSVDTNSAIAGNLSFKQTAVVSSSYGIESLSDYLGNKVTTYGNVSDPANGYYAVCTTTQFVNNCDGILLTQAITWQADAKSRLADGLQLTDGMDAYGNTIEYIIERMCTITGDTNPPNQTDRDLIKGSCLLARRGIDNGSKVVLNEPQVGAPESVTDLPVYRVTVRVTGPKNTTSFVQAFIS